MTDPFKLLKELKDKKWVSLSHVVTSDIPHFEAFNPLRTKDIATIDEDGFWGNEITIGSQYGTHIDAPNHFAKGTRTLLQIPFSERCLPLYVIDISNKVEKNPDYEITKEDILEFEKENRKIEPKSFVALRTDWSKKFGDKNTFINKDDKGIEHTPGWSLEALKFLHEERDVTAIGHETLNTDSGLKLYENKALEAEYYWLSQDKYQVEVLTNLDKLPQTGAIITISYPQISGISGFSAEVNAIY
ncbi:cyclase family protein [Anaerococcus sp.]|uniref:cyclase family protein n=1 Tax=Anaerococcus sp. TaxID=1872515 RepID=UPI0027B9A563|nr:cyclase family protein [Anaerococcus sp.]